MQKVISLLGFAQKAGKLVSGEQSVEITLRKKKIFLLILASDSSENTKSKFKALAKNKEIPLIIYSTKDELGKVIGKSRRSIVGLLDRKFAFNITAALKSER